MNETINSTFLKILLCMVYSFHVLQNLGWMVHIEGHNIDQGTHTIVQYSTILVCFVGHFINWDGFSSWYLRQCRKKSTEKWRGRIFGYCRWDEIFVAFALTMQSLNKISASFCVCLTSIRSNIRNYFYRCYFSSLQIDLLLQYKAWRGNRICRSCSLTPLVDYDHCQSCLYQ